MKTSVLILALAPVLFAAQALSPHVAISCAQQDAVEPATGIATMYYHDPLSRKFSFKTAREGGMFQDHMTKNRTSDIDFGHYRHPAPDEYEFAVGIEGSVEGMILDLGTAQHLSQKYGYSETVGGGQGFASIRIEDDAIVILKDYDEQTVQPMMVADALLKFDDKDDETRAMASAPIAVGHIYLVHLYDPTNHEDRFVKFIVLAYTPGVSVTIRWATF